MAVAFVNLIFVSALLNGIVAGSNQQVVDTMVGNVYMVPKQGQPVIKNVRELKSGVASHDKVQAVTSGITLPAKFDKGTRSGRWPVLAMDPNEYATVFNVKQKMYEGEYLEADDTEGILIGRQIAGGKDMEFDSTSLKDARIGDRLTVTFEGFAKTFVVRGIVYTKFIESDTKAYITEAALNKLVPATKNQATDVYIRTTKTDEEAVQRDLSGLRADTETYLWTEAAGLMRSVSSSFGSINAIMTIVGTIIAAVTTFIVIYVDIVNRRRQIGILRAIGIKPYIIVANYLILAVVYAVLGIALGTVVFFLVLVPYFQRHPFSLPITEAVLNLTYADYLVRLGIISGAAFIAGLVPALLVTKTKMLNAIRGR
jgi:putative ABC transport system permease protein